MKGSEPPRIKVKPQNIKTMEIQIKGFNVKISAKDEQLYHTKHNQHDTLTLLNWLSMALHSGANYQDSITCHAIADDMRNAARELFTICKENGLYEPHNKTR